MGLGLRAACSKIVWRVLPGDCLAGSPPISHEHHTKPSESTALNPKHQFNSRIVLHTSYPGAKEGVIRGNKWVLLQRVLL